MKINKKIMITFLGTIMIGVLIIVSFSSIATIISSQSAADNAANITLEEELLNLDRLARDKSILVDAYFDEIASELNFLRNYAEDLFNGRISLETRQSFYGETSNESSEPPEMFYDPIDDRWISLYASGWYIPEAQPNISRSDAREPVYIPITSLSAEIWDLVNISSNLDYAFKSIFESNPVYLSFYMGFEYQGLFRTYPYKNLDHYPYKEGDFYTEKGYDPRARPWYIDGLEEGDIFFSVPYIFATIQQLGVTATLPVYYDNGSLIGMMGADLTIDSVESSILGLQILESGYAFLINTDGITVIHPDMDREEDPPIITVLEPLPNYILANMKLLNSGQESYTKNEKLGYITFYPVPMSQHSLAIVVPESEILADANQIRSETFLALFVQIIIFLIIVTAVGGAMFLGVREISKRIVEPITELIDMTEQISKGNLHRSLKGSKGGAKEIVVLYDTFRGLLTALRFGNEDYYAGNLSRAMANYFNGLELFTTLNNIKGIGICHNNIGNIHNAKGKLKNAQKSYNKAIEIGEALLEKSSDDTEKHEHTVALASRYNNLGMLYKTMGRFTEAEEYLKKALELDKSIDSVRGFAIRYGNLGQVYLAQKRYDEAKTQIEEAYSIAQSLKSERAITYALMNLGTYHKSIADLEKAKKYFIDAVDRAEDLDIRVVRTSLVNLQEIYEQEGNQQLALEVETKLKALILRNLAPRELYFVLDYSGSMAGSRIRDAKRGILSIFQNQIRDIDYVSFILFDSMVLVKFEPTMKKEGTQDFIRAVKNANQPRYTTAMYDAIGMAYEKIQMRKTGLESWIIVLSDGDDNASQ
ncbi:MAG: tetratricopeptide repeat protein, partial [Candidatus Hodarchaeales archaeon]